MITALRTHQIRRLNETYADITEDPEFRDMAHFFFNDLYHIEDLRERNESFLRLHGYLESMLDLKILSGLKALMDFYFISERLDLEVGMVLCKMGVSLEFSREEYRRAYRYADNYEDRIHQLQVCEESLHFVHSMSHLPFFGAFIKSAQLTARLIGANPMVDFLGRGYKLFRSVESVDPFSSILQERERSRLDEIWEKYGMDDAFALDASERERARKLID